MRLNRVLMYLALTLLVSVHSYANAATVNATMTASVNNIFADDPFGVSLGTQIIVNASYESDAVDLVPSLPTLGRFLEACLMSHTRMSLLEFGEFLLHVFVIR